MKKLVAKLFAPINNATIVLFRIVFGAFMVWEHWHYYQKGWAKLVWADPPFHFKYIGFDWVVALPGDGMVYVFWATAVVAVFFTIGLFYRIAASLLFLGVTYIFLVAQSTYQNHSYLICLLALIMIFIPANRRFSVDAVINKEIYQRYAPLWCLWLLQFQIGVVYFFGGVAKINPDWLGGEPMRLWLTMVKDPAVQGPLFSNDLLVYFMAYAGMLFDLFIVPLLMYRKTQVLAYMSCLIFHLTNAFVFSIGIFPWMMICASTMYFRPEWPEKLFLRKSGKERDIVPSFSINNTLVAVLAIYVMWQCWLPLRHFHYKGNVNWTQQGGYYAWRMKLNIMRTFIRFKIVDKKTNQTIFVDPNEYLLEKQRFAIKTDPDRMLQFAHYIREVMIPKGMMDPAVYVYAPVSLNNRQAQLLINPNVNLVNIKRGAKAEKWLTTLGDEQYFVYNQ